VGRRGLGPSDPINPARCGWYLTASDALTDAFLVRALAPSGELRILWRALRQRFSVRAWRCGH